ncbi:extracellular solute-binding protein [Mesorhizobium sp. YM1C-6-2]|uniref:extracellular solute-binding protein n=1 Tax=Mesorhizobium sp. YM1C-6-2 TaxID=1827501 RepID=UPI000EF1A706|nr:extracellular solute-binding protein [Mesorhizobium sp. YM1C-6-2]RLP27972.1 ABC transporter substrate-binding protein [Mesorhizobium sp. YM1C-6-2]
MTSPAVLFAKALVPALVLFGTAAGAQEWHTTSSLMGESKYGEDFKQYDYVNPDAPKGGTLNSVANGSFDSLNPYVVRGTPAAGLAPFGGGLLYDTLMEQSIDEASVSHPLLAEAFSYPADYSSATYRLDPRAKWHDGQPVTVDDVIWSFNVLKEHSPWYRRYYENVKEAVAVGEREIEFRFDQKGNRELPKIIGDLAVLPKHWWEGTDAKGKKRDITQPTLEPPLGSAAYKIESVKPGQEIVWARVPDYWGAKLPVKIGRENFDKRKYIYILDSNAAWQAFTKGGMEDINPEPSARDWKTKYNFPALERGDVIQKEFKATSSAKFQGFAMNTRRPLFADRRVREALTLAYDFETLNRTVSFGLNKRVDSYFMGSELASSGIPQGKELEILEQFRSELPPELFTQEFKLPVYNTPQDERTHLREALGLLRDAGWTLKDGRLVDKNGQPFEFEILSNSDSLETAINSYANTLRKIGITVRMRLVDTSQYTNRINDYDFDMILASLAQSESPGNEQREFWSSKAADTPGSRNYSGIKNPVVDKLVERVVFATDREDLLAATHALDRVLLWNYYVVPQLTRDVVWLAYWNKFGIPDKQPDYVGPDLDSWWIDPAKESALASKYRNSN